MLGNKHAYGIIALKTRQMVPTQIHGLHGFLEHFLAEDELDEFLGRTIQGAGQDIFGLHWLGCIDSIHL